MAKHEVSEFLIVLAKPEITRLRPLKDALLGHLQEDFPGYGFELSDDGWGWGDEVAVIPVFGIIGEGRRFDPPEPPDPGFISKIEASVRGFSQSALISSS